MTPMLVTRAKAFARKRKRAIIAVAFVLAIVYVPLFPYSPDCVESYTPSHVGPVFLAEDYREGLTAYLDAFGVPYISIDGLVLLRFWTWFNDPESWVVNASNKPVEGLLEGHYDGVSPPPRHITEMVERYRRPNGFIRMACPLVRAVAIDGW